MQVNAQNRVLVIDGDERHAAFETIQVPVNELHSPLQRFRGE